MRASFNGKHFICSILSSLLLAACASPSLGMGVGNPHRSAEASHQEAEIERLVQTGLAEVTLTAHSGKPTFTPATLENPQWVSPTPASTGNPAFAPRTTENLEWSTPTPTPTGDPGFALTPSEGLSPTSTGEPGISPTLSESPEWPAPSLLPESARLSGFTHLYQNMNNCGPATLAMALSYWGWPEDLDDFLREGRQRELQNAVAYALKPEPQDKSVSPHELAAYVEQETQLKALVRAAGNQQLLKSFIAAGLPVIVQRGLDSYVWMGHYQVVSGYDDAQQMFFVYDSYLGPSNAIPTPYQELLKDWRAFNFTYLILFPAEREHEVASILGPDLDLDRNRMAAAALATDELPMLSGRELFFGWYNLGTSLVELQEYQAAATAFDQAFALYEQLPLTGRPWRMLWYQPAPYPAYYHTTRYADLEALASRTIEEAYEPDKPGGPFIEESFYWRGMALAAQGRMDEALKDFRKALELNPFFEPPAEELRRMLGE